MYSGILWRLIVIVSIFKIKKVKKIRKHRGIHILGSKVGKLKKGYKYTGKRLKKGYAQIKKV